MGSENRHGILEVITRIQPDSANLNLNISEPKPGLVCKQTAGVVVQPLRLEFPGTASSQGDCMS